MATVGTLPPGFVTHGASEKDPSVTSTSSIPSSFTLDERGILHGMNDMEEIGLDDDIERGRSQDRKAQRGNLPTTIRDLTHAQLKRPPYPTVQTNNFSSHSHTQSVPPVDHLAAPSASGRSKKSHSTPSLPRNRHSSPAPLSAASYTNGNGVAPLPVGSVYRPKVSPAGPKRTSWQRKTSEQLEEEYDKEDTDDEVPDDAIFYNVPISPRSSMAYSTTPSPDRETRREKNANGTTTPPDAPKIPTVQIIQTNGLGRSKSWSDAMFQLGAEAKELSEALEKHAETEMGQTEKQRKSESLPPKKKSPSTSMELPPLQVSNGIIDPLPISKEKEAVLSRTRPSWLPPKSKEEEKRHLKEYQQMMRRSQEAERKRVQKERAEEEARQKLQNEFSNEWESKIIPNWNRAVRAPETRQLWWKGVAPRCRGQVWALAIGNPLAVSAETYRLALKRAKEIEDGLKKAPTMYSARQRDIFVAIRRDAQLTFPELKIFQETGPLHGALIDVLMAYSMYRSDVGYIYGVHTVAGMLLLNQSPEQAFISIANMLNRPLPLSFFTRDNGAISRFYTSFLKMFHYKLPSLYRHIHQNLRIDPSQYVEPMFLTLFALQCPPDITSRIWDIYAFEGDEFLIRTAVAIMTILESKLYGDTTDILKVLGWNATSQFMLGKEDEFIGMVRSAGREDRSGSV
ncbi:rab-GTPase-TBC domain-containing protein [Pyronema omphalodes]|nr:rab-GTPase-TBC domain-containing protein [Pyronema omphalodes]